MEAPLLAIPIFLPIALVSSALGLTILALLGIKTESVAENTVFGIAVGFGTLAYLVLGIGIAGWLYSPVFIGLLALLAVLSLPGFRAMLDGFSGSAERGSAAKPSAADTLATLAAVGLGGLALVSALAPPAATDWDGLAYHLAVPKMYIAQHKVFYIPFISHSNFPFVTEMLYMLGLGFGSAGAAKLFHWAMFVTAALGLFSLGKRHFSPTAGAAAALLFMSIPVVLWEAGAAYADISTGLFVLLAAYAVLNWESTRDRRWIYLGGILGGFALGTKVLAAIPLLALCVWVLVSGGRSAGWSSGLRRALAMGAAAVVIGSPWYIKSYVYTGNPVYPFLYNVFGGKHWSLEAAQAYRGAQLDFGMGRGLEHILMLPWNITMSGDRFFDSPALIGLIGPVFLGLLAVQVLAGRLHKAVGMLALLSMTYVIGWFFLMQQSRYLITVIPLLCLLAGSAVEIALRTWRIGRHFVGGFVVLCVVLGAVIGCALAYDKGRVAIGAERAEDYLSRSLDVYDAEAYINDSLPNDARIVLFDEVRGFYLNREYIWGNPGHHEMIPYRKFGTGADMVDYFLHAGFTHALVNWRFANGNTLHQRLIANALAAGRMRHIYSRQGVSVYKFVER